MTRRMEIVPVDLSSETLSSSDRKPLLVCLALLPIHLHVPLLEIQERLREADSRHIYTQAHTFHITIKPMGALGDQVRKRNLGRIVQLVAKVAARTAPFGVSLEGLSVFPDAIYVKVRDGKERIVHLNETLAQSLGDLVTHVRYEGADMIPHVTLAHFTASDVDDLLAEVRKASRLRFGRMTLNRITLVKASLRRYFGPERDRVNAFEKIAVFPLGEGPKRFASGRVQGGTQK